MLTHVTIYRDRADAGRQLARSLGAYSHRPNVVVLGLARGGVVVADEVARALQLPLDVFVVRKLGAPQQKELAVGAVASGGVRVFQRDVIEALDLSEADIQAVLKEETAELARREKLYRSGRPMRDLRRQTVILVDDGLATGSTMHAAVLALRQQEPSRIVVAVPVAARQTCEEFRSAADEILCLQTPEGFGAVGTYYGNFSQTSDEEVREILKEADRLSALKKVQGG